MLALLRPIENLTREIQKLYREVKIAVEVIKSFSSSRATKQDLEKVETKIMGKLTEALTSIEGLTTQQADAAVKIEAGIIGLSKDHEKLLKTIKDLQDTQGGVTPEDQSLIDKIQAQATANAAKSKALADAITALDALTPEDEGGETTPPASDPS